MESEEDEPEKKVKIRLIHVIILLCIIGFGAYWVFRGIVESHMGAGGPDMIWKNQTGDLIFLLKTLL